MQKHNPIIFILNKSKIFVNVGKKFAQSFNKKIFTMLKYKSIFLFIML